MWKETDSRTSALSSVPPLTARVHRYRSMKRHGTTLGWDRRLHSLESGRFKLLRSLLIQRLRSNLNRPDFKLWSRRSHPKVVPWRFIERYRCTLAVRGGTLDNADVRESVSFHIQSENGCDSRRRLDGDNASTFVEKTAHGNRKSSDVRSYIHHHRSWVDAR